MTNATSVKKLKMAIESTRPWQVLRDAGHTSSVQPHESAHGTYEEAAIMSMIQNRKRRLQKTNRRRKWRSSPSIDWTFS